MLFDVWMQKVDALLSAKTGMSSADLPDYCYRDEFDGGATPAQAAKAGHPCSTGVLNHEKLRRGLRYGFCRSGWTLRFARCWKGQPAQPLLPKLQAA